MIKCSTLDFFSVVFVIITMKMVKYRKLSYLYIKKVDIKKKRYNDENNE